MTVAIRFVAGTLEVRGVTEDSGIELPAACVWDDRTRCHRAPARVWADLVRTLKRQAVPSTEEARAYGELGSGLHVHRQPRPFQQEAFDAWKAAHGRGVVVLPTGAGKSHVAFMAIDAMRRDTLVVAPTLDLVAQWHQSLQRDFRVPVGVIGGGEYNPLPLTVTTYDSAMIHMENLGARFGLIVFDECHHLPSESYSFAAEASLAPYRLGLTATPERNDGRHELLDDLIGPTVYRRQIGELAGDYLADYTVETLMVELTPEEREAYDRAREVYRGFVREQRIPMWKPDGWATFVMRSSMSAAGREAMQAYQEQKRISFAAPSKLAYVEHLLLKHRRDRVLMFTERNSTAYDLSLRFLVPIITHQTKLSERAEILERFAVGTYNALVTSKVLNEGVDLPSAGVGIVISGSGSVREHVQRLGRILRKDGQKRAILYELVSEGTSEMNTSSRRREHDAYS